MCAGVAKSGSPISRWMTSRPSRSSAFARASTSKAVSVPSRSRLSARLRVTVALTGQIMTALGSRCMAASPGETAYPLLFSEWRIRNATIPNRIVFAPTCPTWVVHSYDGIFTDQAVAYYEERAKGGCGLIIIGGTIIHREALYSEFNFPGLWNDEQVEGLAKVADAVHRHGCLLACQLLHPGLRATAVLKKE